MTETHQAFAARLVADATPLKRARLDTLQVNIGKLCNQACKHCHVDAGPWRQELMSRETVDQVLAFAKAAGVTTVDITGGAPEMNPEFFDMVRRCRAAGLTVIDRCNLTVLFEPGHEDTAQFLADQGVQIVASLPCYLEDNVNRQRGGGVFEKSIQALKLLNSLGYGADGSGLELNLVYNPTGTNFPPPQGPLEADYKRVLADEYGVQFNSLYTITNMPIHRFAADMKRKGEYGDYLARLVAAHNPSAVKNVMCASLISVSWDGWIYDCDFNQMLGMNIGGAAPLHISKVIPDDVLGRTVLVDDHCYGCTAGAGSSCGGALVGEPAVLEVAAV